MEPFVTIETKNIIENYNSIKNYTKKGIIAVIKDNAYGHGLIRIGHILSKLNPLMLCVSTLNDAINLRKNMIFTPILLLGRCDDAQLLYSFKITPSLVCLEQVHNLIKSNLPLSCHIEIETGMHRLGISCEEINDVINMLNNSKMKIKGVYTHFCSNNYQKQLEIFKSSLTNFSQQKLLIHCQASSYINASLDFVNCVRIGLALYGYSSYLKNLKPALNLFIPIVRCQKINKGTPIGYDYIEETPDDGYIITIPWGYSHGLSRLKKLCFDFNGETIFQCGKSCMDLTMFFSKKEIKEGTLIEFFSTHNINNLTIKNDDSVYYLLSSINPSIRRIYH